METMIQSARKHYQSGNLEQAEAIAGEILHIEADNGDALHLLGLIYSQRGDYDLAVKNLKKAIKADPGNADACYDLGNILQDKGEYSKSLTYYRKAIKVSPEYAEAYNNMGIALHDNLQIDKAIKCYQNALKANPHYAEAHNNLGVAFQEKKQLAKAITHFQKALLLKPDYANAYHNLVEAIEGKGYGTESRTQKPVVYAIYRCLYGEDFVQASIKSISDHVDRIFVFWDDKPRGKVPGCFYKGEMVKFPKKFDRVAEKIKELNNPKILLVRNRWDAGENHLTHIMNESVLRKYEKPSVIVSLEVDHVFHRDEFKKAMSEFIEKGYVFATTNTVEVWKGFRHRLPERPKRAGAIFCNMGKLERFPETLKHGGILVMPKLSAYVHDFSFAVSEKAMYWKHLVSIAAARKFGEQAPSEDWYEEKWLKWDFATNNEHLEILAQDENLKAIPYDVDELPELIRGTL